MIINQQGKPYSKRDGSAFVGEFRKNGFLASALFNYLALLGWSPGGDKEKMTSEDMAALFTLDRVKSGPAQMDIKKLTHLNAEYVSGLPLDVFAEEAGRIIAGFDWSCDVDKDYFMKVCELMQTRTHVLSYAEDWGYFLSDDLKYDERAVRKFL